jgi:uncharacterized protein
VTRPLILWLLGDGKPGHENQSLGLAEAIARLVPSEIHRISLATQRGMLRRVQAAVKAGELLPKADFIIGAGHATHLALFYLARKFGCQSIVLMRPSLPMSLFNLCIVPAHDFKKPPSGKNLVLTQGALNRVSPPDAAVRRGKVVLLGGPSRTHGWDGNALTAQLAELTQTGPFLLTDSRRTPSDFMVELAKHLPGVEIYPHQQTAPDWLPQTLAAAEEIWVTEDSVSMIYEALSSGAKVGLLSVPRLEKDSRVLRGLEQLKVDGYLTPFADWQQTHQLTAPPSTLREADRCAEGITRKFRF